MQEIDVTGLSITAWNWPPLRDDEPWLTIWNYDLGSNLSIRMTCRE